MAEQPVPKLIFAKSCADCGHRKVSLPPALPAVGEDFDYLVRDYDGFRLFMLEELAARFPERRRWTPADMEVVLVETLSVALDQLSDMLDRVHGEAFLQSARRPESVRRLLSMIGYDAPSQASDEAAIPSARAALGEDNDEKRSRLSAFHPYLLAYAADYEQALDELTPAQLTAFQAFLLSPTGAPLNALDAVQQFLDNAPNFAKRACGNALERYWYRYPQAMEQAREAGPAAIHQQKRMVSTADYAMQLEKHPLVLRAHAFSQWSGAWTSLCVVVVLVNNVALDTPLDTDAVGGAKRLQKLTQEVHDFHQRLQLPPPLWGAQTSARLLLRPFIEAYRMAAQEVFLQDAVWVGINISLSVRIGPHYFQSEIEDAITEVLGAGVQGFFAPGRLAFGEDLHASDVIEVVTALDGVEAVCLNRFKRVGKRYADAADGGHIRLQGLEIAVCDNNKSIPARGILRITLHGGQRG
ncbi:hypothetical protein P2G88_03745 [Aliiglaciecola sp. CAU 1673]|uniref:hypothetical protein n=1 Tax=Aliiglaciecola sp. CAU 1673 TaxID=3032595 RepID=UPI0023D9B1DC|nr:hypothetical protein [Aliiglaciecola sp. CAU 1673]MDF2177357.1 hypothetical protein [Aliiglaciecola sp. CAU 1673]